MQKNFTLRNKPKNCCIKNTKYVLKILASDYPANAKRFSRGDQE